MCDYEQIMIVAFKLARLTCHDFFPVSSDYSKIKMDNLLVNAVEVFASSLNKYHLN